MGYGSDKAPGFESYAVNGETVSRSIFEAFVDVGQVVRELKERTVKQEEQLQAYETQLTLQEDGPKSLLERLERQKRDLDYYAGRVAELEAHCKLRNDAILRDNLQSLIKERDQLQQRVAELEEMRETHTKFWEHKLKKAYEERDQLRGERDEARTVADAFEKDFHELKAELQASREDLNTVMLERNSLRRELEALKPKPVVIVNTVRAETDGFWEHDENLRLTFEDGKLVEATVIK